MKRPACLVAILLMACSFLSHANERVPRGIVIDPTPPTEPTAGGL